MRCVISKTYLEDVLHHPRLLIVALLALCLPLSLSGCGDSCVEGSMLECTAADGRPGQMKCFDGEFGACDAIAGSCRDGTKRDCSTACGTGQESCTGGVWAGDCDAAKPQAEICDGLDNNCDGKIDETCGCTDGVTDACYEGALATRGVGVCRDGSHTCNRGNWGVCVGQVLPAVELCDGLDNNCDGTVDEGCSCQNGESGACYDGAAATRGVGLCKDGSHTCNNGSWSLCAGQVLPATEACDGLDNNCDGVVDDGCQCRDGQKQGCTTACGAGEEICVGGTWQNCDAPKPLTETCDGLDNNCNGQIDETCGCVHGRTEACWEYAAAFRNVGTCRDGSKLCTAGVWGACLGQVAPEAAENCLDALDNNCNGTVNDTCTCSPNTNQPCGTDVGECTAGIQYCDNNAWGACLGEVVGAAETCNGLDDDCDGAVDNGLDADALEPNDSCIASTMLNVDDTAASPTVLSTTTLYPSGDVDYFQVTAADGSSIDTYCGFFNRKPQCHFLDVEMVNPAGGTVPYKASLMAYDCASAPFADSNNQWNETGSVWHGRCVDDDSIDYWVKVEPKAGATPSSSCEPYELRLVHTSENYDCCTMVACFDDSDCIAENWGCGGCSGGYCGQRCEVTACDTNADCTAVGCGSCDGSNCVAL